MAILELRKGDRLSLQMIFTNADEPFDVTGWTVDGATLSFPGCPDVDVVAEITDPVSGEGAVTLDAEATANLHEGNYTLQVRLISPDHGEQSTRPLTIRVRA